MAETFKTVQKLYRIPEMLIAPLENHRVSDVEGPCVMLRADGYPYMSASEKTMNYPYCTWESQMYPTIG